MFIPSASLNSLIHFCLNIYVSSTSEFLVLLLSQTLLTCKFSLCFLCIVDLRTVTIVASGYKEHFATYNSFGHFQKKTPLT